MKNGRFPLGAVILLFAGFILGWAAYAVRGGGSGHAEEKEEEAPEVEPGAMSVPVKTAPIEEGELPIVLTAAGVVEASESSRIAVTSRAHGRLSAGPADPGTSVKKGDVFARFETAPLEVAVKAADLATERARAELDAFRGFGRDQKTRELEAAAARAVADTAIAKSALDRLKPLLGDALVSKKSIEDAAAALHRAEIDASAAAADLEKWKTVGAPLEESSLDSALRAADLAAFEARAALAEAAVTAPADGTIEEVSAATGRFLESGAPIATIRTAGGLRVAFDLSPEEAARITLGAEAAFSDPAHRTVRAAVSRIMPAVEAGTGFVIVQAAIDAAAKDLSIGLLVGGSIVVGKTPRGAIVPAAAVLRVEGETMVVLVDSAGTARPTPVHVLAEADGRIAVRAEAPLQGAVIIEGAQNLPEGAKVRIDGESAASRPSDGKEKR